MWVQLIGEEDLPKRGALKRYQLASGPTLAVLRGKDGEIYVMEDAVPPLRQSFLGPGASVDARLLRGTCNVFGTKFDLQSGEVQGPWCPAVEQSPLLLALLLRLVLLFCRLVGSVPSRLHCFQSRRHQGKLEVRLDAISKNHCDVPLALARWLLVPSTHRASTSTSSVDVKVVPVKEDIDTEEVKISVVPKDGTSELGRAFLRLPKSKTQPQMAEVVRQSFAQPSLKDTEARCAVWVAQYVIPEARGKGLDQKMLSKILDVVHSRGFDFLLLMVDGRSQHLKTQLEAHYESQGFVKIAEPNIMGLQRAMLRPVRSDGLLRPAAGTVTSRSRSTRVPSSLREAAQDGVDVGKNAFLLAHGYVCLPLLLEFVKMLPSLRSQRPFASQLQPKTGPFQVLLRAMMILGYVKDNRLDTISVVESDELQAWEELLTDDILELYKVPLPMDRDDDLTDYLSLRRRLRRKREDGFQRYPAMVLAMFDAALLAPLAVALVAEGEKTSRMRALQHGEEVDLLLREMGLGSCQQGKLELKTFPLQRCQTLLVACSYAPMLAKFHHVLYEEPSWGFTGDFSEEVHVTRTLNVLGSGLQHKAFFRDLLELLQPLFMTDFKQQPLYVADTGCGDGSLLLQIYDFVKQRTPRGQHLEEYPLTMIGIDLNSASLKAAGEKLSKAQVPHQLITGDIGQPGAILQELRGRKIDPRDVLHVRSFLDHDRPYVAPKHQMTPGSARAHFVRHCFAESAYLDRLGQAIAPEEVYQSLVEHLTNWSSALHDKSHGLCLLEAMSLDVKTTQKYFNDNVSFHFDIEAALSRQYLVPAKAFCMALAEAGLFSVAPQKVRCYPESGEYCRIMNQHVKRWPYRIRLAEESDLDALETLQRKAEVGPALKASRKTLAQRLRLAADGTFVAESEGLLGAIYTTHLESDAEPISAEPMVPSKGEMLQIIALHALPQAPGVGAMLRDFVLQLQRVGHGGAGAVGLSRCGEWSSRRGNAQMSMEDYIRKHQSGEISDKVLAFHTTRGAHISGVVPNARPKDVENQGAAVMIHYDLSSDPPRHQDMQVCTAEVASYLQSELQIDMEANDVTPLHLDSLELAQLQRRLEHRFAIHISLNELLDCQRPSQLLEAVMRSATSRASDLQVQNFLKEMLNEACDDHEFLCENLDSLDLARLQSAVRREFDVDLTLEELPRIRAGHQ